LEQARAELIQTKKGLEQARQRIAELEQERSERLRVAGENPKQRRPESRGAVEEKDTTLKKLIRRLDSPENDNEAAVALRALARELQARGRGFAELGKLTTQWDQEDAVVRPPKPRPIDWSEVESAVKTYTEGKTKVTINKVFKAVHAHVPATTERQRDELRGGLVVAGFVDGCLRRLGFVRRGEMTYERIGPTN
jgi:hypothetical protein